MEQLEKDELKGTTSMNEQTSQELASKAAETAQGVKETVRGAKEKIRTATKEVASQFRDRGQEFLQEKKTRAARRLEQLSESARESAERFEEEDDPNIAHFTGLVADRLERAAVYVREQDFGDLQRDAENLARRYPAVFFSGMFILGLAAARFFKASAEHQLETSEEGSEESGSESENGSGENGCGSCAEESPQSP